MRRPFDSFSRALGRVACVAFALVARLASIALRVIARLLSFVARCISREGAEVGRSWMMRTLSGVSRGRGPDVLSVEDPETGKLKIFTVRKY